MFLWCPYVTPAEALNFYVVGNTELGDWTVGIAVVQVLVAATWACGNNPVSKNVDPGLTSLQSLKLGEFKPNMFPKPTKRTQFWFSNYKHHFVQWSCHCCFQANRAGKKPFVLQILRRSYNEIYMMFTIFYQIFPRLDPWNLIFRKVEFDSFRVSCWVWCQHGRVVKSIWRFIWLCKIGTPELTKGWIWRKLHEKLYITIGLTRFNQWFCRVPLFF